MLKLILVTLFQHNELYELNININLEQARIKKKHSRKDNSGVTYELAEKDRI